MIGRIEFEDSFKEVFSAGCIPAIKAIIEEYENSDDEPLYGTMFAIGCIVENYYSIFQTGNIIDALSNKKRKKEKQ